MKGRKIQHSYMLKSNLQANKFSHLGIFAQRKCNPVKKIIPISWESINVNALALMQNLRIKSCLGGRPQCHTSSYCKMGNQLQNFFSFLGGCSESIKTHEGHFGSSPYQWSLMTSGQSKEWSFRGRLTVLRAGDSPCYCGVRLRN